MATRQRRTDPRRAALAYYRMRYEHLLFMAGQFRALRRHHDAESATAGAARLALALRAERLDPEPA